MKFIVFQPTQKKEFSISWLEVQTPVGSFVIQPGHAPIVLTVQQEKAIIIMLTSGKQEIIPIGRSGGLIEINRNKITLLLNS